MAGTDWLPRRVDRAFDRLASSDPEKNLLAMMPGNPRFLNWWDDFVGDSLDARYQASFGTGTEVQGITAAGGGTATLTTGTTSGDSCGLTLGLHWTASEQIYFIARAKIDNIATSKFEIGLSDGIARDGVVNVKATPTFNATNGAVIIRDTTEDTATTFITANGGAVGANVDSTIAAVADTYFIVEIVVKGGFASGYINGNLVGGGAIASSAVLTPHALVTTRTTATRTLTIDYWGITSPITR